MKERNRVVLKQEKDSNSQRDNYQIENIIAVSELHDGVSLWNFKCVYLGIAKKITVQEKN